MLFSALSEEDFTSLESVSKDTEVRESSAADCVGFEKNARQVRHCDALSRTCRCDEALPFNTFPRTSNPFGTSKTHSMLLSAAAFIRRERYLTTMSPLSIVVECLNVRAEPARRNSNLIL